MPLVTVFNLRKEDRLSEIEVAAREALVSIPQLRINDYEVDLVPVVKPDGFHGTVTRINVESLGRKRAHKRGSARTCNTSRQSFPEGRRDG